MHRITKRAVRDYERHLAEEERAPATIEKYMRDIGEFREWLGRRLVTRRAVLSWKASLSTRSLAVSTINGKLSSLNGFFSFLRWRDCNVRFLRVQRKPYCSKDRELSLREYRLLLKKAREEGQTRLALAIETICSTGIRVSETQYVTVEAARKGEALIRLKGKCRMVLLPKGLCRRLLAYAKHEGIAKGAIFRTSSGRPYGRRQIWGDMKRLGDEAGIGPDKVFPHNLRHLFARTHYGQYHDISMLADILGHSDIETTRIYLVSTGEEHAKSIERLGLGG